MFEDLVARASRQSRDTDASSDTQRGALHDPLQDDPFMSMGLHDPLHQRAEAPPPIPEEHGSRGISPWPFPGLFGLSGAGFGSLVAPAGERAGHQVLESDEEERAQPETVQGDDGTSAQDVDGQSPGPGDDSGDALTLLPDASETEFERQQKEDARSKALQAKNNNKSSAGSISKTGHTRFRGERGSIGGRFLRDWKGALEAGAAQRRQTKDGAVSGSAWMKSGSVFKKGFTSGNAKSGFEDGETRIRESSDWKKDGGRSSASSTHEQTDKTTGESTRHRQAKQVDHDHVQRTNETTRERPGEGGKKGVQREYTRTDKDGRSKTTEEYIPTAKEAKQAKRDAKAKKSFEAAKEKTLKKERADRAKALEKKLGKGKKFPTKKSVEKSQAKAQAAEAKALKKEEAKKAKALEKEEAKKAKALEKEKAARANALEKKLGKASPQPTKQDVEKRKAKDEAAKAKAREKEEAKKAKARKKEEAKKAKARKKEEAAKAKALKKQNAPIEKAKKAKAKALSKKLQKGKAFPTKKELEKKKKDLEKKAKQQQKQKEAAEAKKIKAQKAEEKKRKTLKDEGPKSAGKSSTYDDISHDEAMGRYDNVNTALAAMKIGSVGDESGIDYTSFGQKRENTSGELTVESGTKGIENGRESTVGASAGKMASGSTLSETTSVDPWGNVTKSKSGATGEAHVGAKASASARKTSHKGKDTYGVNAKTSIGAGAEGEVGATSSSDYGGGFSGNVGAMAGGKAFVGARAEGDASVSKSRTSVGAKANADIFAGVEADAHAGANANISVGGFEMVGARAKASGKAMAGAEAKANAEANASVTGVSASGSVGALAGAKASGDVSAGVSAGGVDADVVAEGEAMAGAEADANASASLGLAGISAAAGAGAFAGVKAGGQVRAELGAGGLNFGLVGVSGEVSAGAGAEARGEAYAQWHKTGAAAEASAAVGVGAGAGIVLTVDPSFPVRLPLEKLAENGVIPTSNIAELVTTAVTPVVTPVVQGAKKAILPKTKSSPKATRSAVTSGGPPPAATAAAEPAMGGGQGPMHPDDAKATLSPAGQDSVNRAETKVVADYLGGGRGAAQAIKSATNLGGELLKNVQAFLSSGLRAIGDAGDAAGNGLRSIIGAAIGEARGLFGTLASAAASAVKQLGDFKLLNPVSLIDGAWEGNVDAIVARVHNLIGTIAKAVRAIVDRVRAAGHRLIDTGIESGLAPVRSLGNSAASMVGGFGATFAGLGRRALSAFGGGLKKAEKGYEITDKPEGGESQVVGQMHLQPGGSEVVGTMASAMGEVETGGKDFVKGAVNDIGEKLTGGLKDGLKATHDKVGMAGLEMLAQTAESDAKRNQGTVKAVASGIKSFLRPIAEGARWAAEQARKAVEAARKAAAAAAAAAKEAARWAAEKAKQAAATVGNVVKSVGGFFKGLFG